MSVSAYSKHKCLLVTHDAVNFSPAKAKYSFSRDQRFKSITGTTRTPSEFNHHLPHTFGRRSPSFGVGERFKTREAKGKYRDAAVSLWERDGEEMEDWELGGLLVSKQTESRCLSFTTPLRSMVLPPLNH